MSNVVYVVADIEADGPCPGVNSMLSLGAVAYDEVGERMSTKFYATLDPLPGASQDPGTLKWWASQQEAWKMATQGTAAPSKVMHNFVRWVESLGRRRVFVAYPASFDFTWVYWYCHRFTGRSPFGFSSVLDMKALAAFLLNCNIHEIDKRGMPERWTRNLPKHTHIAIDDAEEQGEIFRRMLLEWTVLKEKNKAKEK